MLADQLNWPDRTGEPASLLVERIVVCWLYMQIAELRAPGTRSACGPRAEFLQRQVDRAQRRFLSAVRSLAAVRRLALPVNLNVAIGVVGRGKTLRKE